VALASVSECINCIVPTLSCLVRFSSLHIHISFHSLSLLSFQVFVRIHQFPSCNTTTHPQFVRPLANAMYYPQQSPGIAHKLSSTHPDPSPWARPTHPYGPPPPSPGYPLYTNGSMPHHMQSLHHHQNSISHYPSPPSNGVSVNVLGQTLGVGQGSPGSASSQIITPHWQQQLLKCEVRLHLLASLGSFHEPIFFLSADDSCLSVPSPSRSRQRHGLSHRNKVRNPHHKSQ
jgi:hypothetical protein